MTVESTIFNVVLFSNGTVGPYPAGFKIFDETHLEVSVGGVLQTLNSDYTVSGVGEDAFSITFTAPPASNAEIVIQRMVPLVQEVDYQANDPFPAETHERALDLLTMALQQVAGSGISKAIRVPTSDPSTLNLILPEDTERAGKLFAFDGTGQPTVQTQSAVTGIEPNEMLVKAVDTPSALRLEEHTSWFFTPQMFGAVGNGVADDTAALQATIDAAQTERGLVLIPAGTYLITNTLVLDENETLVGAGGVIRASAALGVAVQLGTATDIFLGELRGVVVDKAAHSASPVDNTGVQIVNAAQALLDHVEVRNFDIGVDLIPDNGQRVSYCTFIHPYWNRGRITLRINPRGTGFASENTWFGGRFQTTAAGPLEHHIFMNNIGTGGMNHNRFIAMSLEGGNDTPNAVHCIELVNGFSNYFENCRTEGADWPAAHIKLGGSTSKNYIVLSRDDTSVEDDGGENVVSRRGALLVRSVPIDFEKTDGLADNILPITNANVVARFIRSFGSTSAAIAIVASNDQISSIRLGDTDDEGVGGFEYAHTNNLLTIVVGGAGRAQVSASALRPVTDNAVGLGDGTHRWTEVFAATGAINTSDAREKERLGTVPDEVLDAWAEVDVEVYRWWQAVEEKGPAARRHVGVVAQEIEAAFKRHGLDAREWGLFCRDGDRYSIRPDQCLFLETALLRRELRRR